MSNSLTGQFIANTFQNLVQMPDTTKQEFYNGLGATISVINRDAIGTVKMFYPPTGPSDIGNYFNTTSGVGVVGTDWEGWALCLTGDSKVLLSNGEEKTIKEIVDNRLDVEVYSFDENSKKLVKSKVIDFYKEKVLDKSIWYTLKVTDGISNRSVLNLTENHPVWIVDKGWVEASNIEDGDKIINYSKGLSEYGKSAMLGMYLSDGCINKGRFIFSQSTKYRSFVKKMAKRFNVDCQEHYNHTAFMDESIGYGAGKGYKYIRFRVSLKTTSTDMLRLFSNKSKVSEDIINRLDPISLAYWYMGDGTLKFDKRYSNYFRMQVHTEGFNEIEMNRLTTYLNSIGCSCVTYKRKNLKKDKEYSFIRFTEDGTKEFSKIIAPYIEEEFKYKLPSYITQYGELISDKFTEYEKKEYSVSCKKLMEQNKNTIKWRKSLHDYNWRYDIKIEGTRSFIANNIVVHNCDGQTHNGINTPDLRGRFIVGYYNGDNDYGTVSNMGPNIGTNGSKYDIVDDGKSIRLKIPSMPSHDHAYEKMYNAGDGYYTVSGATYKHFNTAANTDQKGQDEPHENRPPYYTLCYVIRVI